VLPPFSLIYKFIFMPVMELLTEASERSVVGFKEPGGFALLAFLKNILVGALNAVIMTCLQLVILVVLLPLNFIPLVGSAVWLIVPPAIFASLDYTDINLVRRGYTTREKLRLWWHHQWRFFGFGVAFFFFITIPVLNAVVIPAAAAGGALLYLELDRK
jgi:CysZ protein